ncbi:Na+/H+ antiporter subunit E [Skermania piniformis]|uniref:Na+/H+ antiporter subunit E n=1 Tax=Skermania pinensis TaxID=39122 RepID=A0ABX8SAS6_9ACTN|nr:Na+/H+ antiporter subunit E [Skermania piniformis]QXQ14277.1 Na+/H+ antiporter subunit E [Skermania piniformis]
MTGTHLIRIAVVVWLAVVYCWLWGTVSVGNILAGLLLGAAITVLLPLPRLPVGGWLRPLPLLQLLGVIGYYALISSVQVALLALRRDAPPPAGVLRVSLAIRSDLVLVLCCDALTVIPGSMVLEIDAERRMVYVHVLDIGSERAVAEFYRSTRRLEQLFIRTFESRPTTGPAPR